MSGIFAYAVMFLLLILAIFVPRPPKCEHTNIRCVHGDEINMTGGARGACRDCPETFPDLPLSCSHSHVWTVYRPGMHVSLGK